ncbi:hypothetical protein DPPLL_38390 [Desulfofustis limnaeus]|uniref:Secreted protein n=1 Tax=Desulfofustis limnaeus TaxID=2740163 RepID=A0ABM7WEV7_9BACT|nr:hypothetical protein DPPLL_38390 [Desulfofustis limnaeus]
MIRWANTSQSLVTSVSIKLSWVLLTAGLECGGTKGVGPVEQEARPTLSATRIQQKADDVRGDINIPDGRIVDRVEVRALGKKGNDRWHIH